MTSAQRKKSSDQGGEVSEGPAPRVLVVEDEPDIAALLAYQLAREGLRVETAADGKEALAALGREIPDLVVLDRMLPGLSGDDVLRFIRAEPSTRTLPVLVVTAQKEEEHRIEGLELGADDYLTKPFSPRELVLRAKALLRRAKQAQPVSGGQVLRSGPLRLDVAAHEVKVDGEEVVMTPTEFRLLQALMERPGRTQSRAQLLQKAWEVGGSVSDRIETRTVDMHIRRLRGKLGAWGPMVETVRGFGYRLRGPEDPS